MSQNINITVGISPELKSYFDRILGLVIEDFQPVADAVAEPPTNSPPPAAATVAVSTGDSTPPPTPAAPANTGKRKRATKEEMFQRAAEAAQRAIRDPNVSQEDKNKAIADAQKRAEACGTSFNPLADGSLPANQQIPQTPEQPAPAPANPTADPFGAAPPQPPTPNNPWELNGQIYPAVEIPDQVNYDQVSGAMSSMYQFLKANATNGTAEQFGQDVLAQFGISSIGELQPQQFAEFWRWGQSYLGNLIGQQQG